MRILFLALFGCLLLMAEVHAQQAPAVGSRVEVLSAGKWYPATVLEIGNGGPYTGLPKVHYDGYGAEFDEYVNLDRVRAAAQPGPSVARPTATQSPEGRYTCVSFEAGQLLTQGEFVLTSDGTYREILYKEQGTWALSGTKLSFTGVLDNGGQATFYPDRYRGRRRNGVIAFDWGNGVIRECYRNDDSRRR